jgi:hypothetical protein
MLVGMLSGIRTSFVVVSSLAFVANMGDLKEFLALNIHYFTYFQLYNTKWLTLKNISKFINNFFKSTTNMGDLKMFSAFNLLLSLISNCTTPNG